MMRLLTALLITVSQIAFAGVYELKFQRVGAANEQARCQAFAERTAAELASQSGAVLIDYGCQMDEYTSRGWDAVLTYQASEALVRTSTYSASVYSSAFYADRGACEKYLETQKQIFAHATGLKPLTAYCMLDIGLTPTWASRVDGLGKAKLNPDSAGVAYWGTLLDAKAVLSEFQTAAQGYGIVPFEVGVSYGFGKHIVLRYYAAEPYSIEDYDATKYESARDCIYAASKVKSFVKAAEKPVTVFCEQSNDGGATLHTTALAKILTPKSVFKAKALTTQFYSLAECQQKAETIVTGGDILGAICAGSNKSFRIHLFSRP